MVDDEDKEFSPFEAIERLVGPELAARISARFGGRRFYVPAKPGPNHPLSIIVGHEAAVKIGLEFRGAKLSIPLGQGKRARIASMREAGKSVAAIAAALQCTERHVYYVLAEQRGGSKQSDLFPSCD